jgi:DNA-binding NarL/FixJ family response regulator
MKILIVDDHPLIREALRHVLKALDAEIELVEAANSAEAFAALDGTADIRLILLDLGLPDIDGFEALAQLRTRHPETPIVVLSATESADVVTRAIDGGAMGFIPKTASNQLLLNALRIVLAGGVYLPAEILRMRASGGVPGRTDSGATPAAPAAGSPAEKLRSPRDFGFTARQSDVLALLVQGKPNKLICRELNLAEGTVKVHVTAILKALNVTNRTQAVIAVSRLGLQLPRR